MPTILITGADGQVGRELLALQSDFPKFTLLPVNRHAMDITDAERVARFFGENTVDYCINCAAYTAVDRAESEPELARLINVEATGFLARACRAHGVPLLHLSSDYVYHNDLNRPLCEDDPTEPRSVYARTKLEGERRARDMHPATLVVRTSWVYAPLGHNFVRTMRRLGAERDELRVVYDQVGAPTYARDLAAALLTIADRHTRGQATAEQWSDVYNFANEGVTSWYDFALAIFEDSGVDCRVMPILSAAFPTPARRPPFSLLNKDKIKAAFDLSIPHWRESLRHCLSRMESS